MGFSRGVSRASFVGMWVCMRIDFEGFRGFSRGFRGGFREGFERFRWVSRGLEKASRGFEVVLKGFE